MSNHFHLLVLVPEPQEIDDKELIRRIGLLYQDNELNLILKEFADLKKSKDLEGLKRFRDKFLCRMYNVSEFMKTLKQRFSIWFNHQHQRVGTLWEERFKSILVEGRENALLAMATYIDLNPIRAGIVQDPKDYRYSGHAEAREGLGMVMLTLGAADKVWGQISHIYRRLLYEHGRTVRDKHGCVKKIGFTDDEIEKVVSEGGILTMGEILKCRVRYFSDGMVLGSKEFVDTVFQKHRHMFGAKRTSGARPMRWADWQGLCTIRDLRANVIG
jgi:REP element-mobilizing transposase RayT